MAIPLKYNTASQEIPLGYFVDSTDGSTTETGLTIANTDIKLWKSGATTLANKNSGGATHISDGVYYAVLDATDCNTYGPMKIFVNVSGALPVILECLVMEADAYDALYAAAGTGHIEADAVQISGDATAANNAESFFDGTGYAGTNNVIPAVTTVTTTTNVTNQVTADVTAISGDSVAADNLELDYDGTGYAKANSTIGTTTTNTDMVAAAPTAAAVADAVWDEAATGHTDAGKAGEQLWTDVDAILADTNELQTNQGAWATAVGFSTHTAANVRTEMDANSTQLIAIVADTNELQTDDVPGLIAALNDPTAAAIADAVWDEAIAGHVGAGSTGEALNNATAPTAAAVADAVWEELIADHSGTSGSTAEALNAAGAAGDPWVTALPGAYGGGSAGNIVGNLNDPTAAAIADAVLDEALSGHVAAGSLGKAVADIETDATAILADTNELQTDDVPGLIAALNDISTAQVNAEVDTALADIDLDHLVNTATAIPAVTAGTFLDQMMDDGTAVYDRTTDSLQALRDRGDAAWITGGGGSITDILNIQPLIPESIDLANTASWRLGIMLTNALDDLPSTVEITPGTIDIDRKAIGGTTWSSVVSGAACSEAAGLIYYDEVFDSGTGYAEGDSIRVTFKSQKITVAANDYEISDTTGRIFYTEMRQTSTGSSAATIADAVWDEALSGHVAAGSFGKSVADIETDATAILADTNELQTDDVPGLIAALNDFNSASDTVIVTEIQAAALADMFNTDSGTTYGAAVAGSVVKEVADNAGGSGLTEAGIADAVWDEAAAGHVAAGSFGALVGAMGDTLWDEVINAGAPANAQTARELMNIFASALAGKTNSGSGSQFIGRDLADSKDVITAGLDSDGFRTSMTLDGS